jgi:LysR family transcriptional regulator for bpeEF and oprC
MRSQIAHKPFIFKLNVHVSEQFAMNRLQAMEVFVRVVDTASFTRCAEQMGLPKATVSTLVQQLEQRLGVRLLNRTTRRVSVTVEGATYYERCVRILADVEDSEHEIAGTRTALQGRLRVDVGAVFGRRVLVPALPGFFARYPGIRLELGCSDRVVDAVEEGVDCFVRVGSLPASDLVAQPVGVIDLLYCAAPAYIAARGVPTHPEDLVAHDVVGYFASRYRQAGPREIEIVEVDHVSSRHGQATTWNFNRGDTRLELGLDGPFAVNDSEAYLEAGLAGLGVIQTTTFMAEEALREGRLVRLLPEWRPDPLPLYVMYPESRRLSAKVRVLVDWVSSLLARAVEDARLPAPPA